MPPKKSGNGVQARKSKGYNFKLCQCQTLHVTRYALDNEPKHLQDSNSFRQEIAFRLVPYFGDSNVRKDNSGLLDEGFKSIQGKCDAP